MTFDELLARVLELLQRSASLRRALRLKINTARPSPWPTSWACASSWRTATSFSMSTDVDGVDEPAGQTPHALSGTRHPRGVCSVS